MKLTVNGRSVEFGGGAVINLIDELKIEPDTVVVEKNGNIVHRDFFADEKISDGDVIEIVKFVGGG